MFNSLCLHLCASVRAQRDSSCFHNLVNHGAFANPGVKYIFYIV